MRLFKRRANTALKGRENLASSLRCHIKITRLLIVMRRGRGRRGKTEKGNR